MFDHFDFLAPFYDNVITAKPPQRLRELLDISPGMKLLDAGGGTGRIAQFLVGQAHQLVLADTSRRMLEKSQEKPGLLQVNAATESLPFRPDYFDRILMVDALHHVSDQPQTANELWRVVKPGGKIVIEEPDIERLVVKLVAAAEKIALMRSHFLSAVQIGAMFSQASARIKIHREEHLIWVVVEKPPPSSE